MEFLGDALSISGMAIVMVFAVLVLLMLAMNMSASILGKSAPAASQPGTSAAVTQGRAAPVVEMSQETDQVHTAVIFAALQAAEVDLPSGGRIRIEKVSRQG